MNTTTFNWRVILAEPYCGSTQWVCWTMGDAISLVQDFLARGVKVLRIERPARQA